MSGASRRDLPQVPPTRHPAGNFPRVDPKPIAEHLIDGAQRGLPVANPFNLASRIQEMVNAQIDAAPFRNVTHVQVYTAQPTASGRGATFTIVMTGPDLNPSNPDTRRIYTVRVTDSPAAR